MTTTVARRILTAVLTTLAAAIVFTPLAAALAVPGSASAGPTNPFGRPLGRSIGVALMAALVAFAIGLPFAVVVDRSRPLVRRLCWGLAFLALIVPPYIVAESTIVLMGPTGKISRGIALMCGFGPPASDAVDRARFAVPPFVYSATTAGVVLGGCLFPIVALAAAGANRRTDRRIFESARLIRGRAGVASVAAHVLIPPAAGGALLVFGVALTESVVPQLLRVQTAGEAIYERIQEGDLHATAAMSLPLLPLILLAGAAGMFILVRTRTASLAGLEGDVPRFDRRPGGPTSDALALLTAGLATAQALLIPFVGLAWLTVTAKRPETVAGKHQLLRASGFFESLRGAWDLAHDDALRTMTLAALAATLATVLAVALIRSAGRSRWVSALGALGAGLAVPAPVVGLGLIYLWNRSGAATIVYQSAAIVLLGWLARFLPVAILLAQAGLARVPVELEHAAALSGHRPLRRFAAVILPAAAPALAAAWLAVYVLSATEFATTLLISPPGSSLLAPSVVNLMRRGQDPEIAACQVLLLAVVAAPIAVLAIIVVVRRTWRRVL